jgi:hypothetical protein
LSSGITELTKAAKRLADCDSPSATKAFGLSPLSMLTPTGWRRACPTCMKMSYESASLVMVPPFVTSSAP